MVIKICIRAIWHVKASLTFALLQIYLLILRATNAYKYEIDNFGTHFCKCNTTNWYWIEVEESVQELNENFRNAST